MTNPSSEPAGQKLSISLRKFWRNHLQDLWHRLEWPAIALFVAVILGLGYIGINDYNSSMGEASSLPDTVYSLLRFFILGSDYVSGTLNFELQVVRFLAPLFPFYMILMIINPLVYERIQMFYLRWFVRGHIIICGMDMKSLAIARNFYDQGYRLVVVDKNPDKDMIEKCRNIDAIIIPGDPSDIETLRKAQVEKARYVISVLDDENVNAMVAVNVGRLLRNKKNKALTCYVHIADMQLWGLLRGYQLNMGRIDSFRVEFINIYDSGARILLNKYRDDKASMVIIGPGRIGESLAIEAARDRFFNGIHEGGKLRMVLVDKNAKERKEALIRQYPGMARSCDMVPFNADIKSLKKDQLNTLAETFSDSRIYICAGDDVGGVSIALSLLPYLADDQTALILCTEHGAGLADLLKNSDGGSRVQLFSLMDDAYGQDVLLGGINSILARAIHDIYIKEQKTLKISPSSNSSIVTWDELPEDLRESNRRSADHIQVKLHAVGCDIMPMDDWGEKVLVFTGEEVEKMSFMEHERWVNERVLQGFSYSPEKDTGKKKSPYIVDWDKLPDDIKEYDRNIVRNLPTFLAHEGFRVYRLNGGPTIEAEIAASTLAVR